MVIRMNHPLMLGLLLSSVIAMLAKIPLPIDPSSISPEVWWLIKAAGGVVIVESLRRAFVILVLDRFFPDRAAAARLTWWQRWRTRHDRTDLNLKD